MENYNEQEKKQEEAITFKIIFTEIWTSPRRIFRFIEDAAYEKHLILLMVLAGIGRTFDRATMKDMGDKYPLEAVILFCILGGIAFGWISFYIYGGLLRWTGTWIGGRAGFKSILRVLVYGNIPIVCTLVLLFIQIGIYGEALFQSDGDLVSAGIGGNITFWGSMIVELMFIIWAVVLIVIGLSEVQGFSVWKALLNLILPALILIVPLLIIVGTIFLLIHLVS